MTNTMTLVDWLDDLCVRFIVNLPQEELNSAERICFQIEEAQWFYEDFIRPLDPNIYPSMHLRKFSQLMFQHCPLFSAYSVELHQHAYERFLAYKTRVPVRGAIMLNQEMTHAVLVKGWKKGAKWSFPRGKINKEEPDLDCAVREVYEETGYDLTQTDLVLPDEEMKKITVTMREQSMMLYVFRGVPMDTYFEPKTRKEISKIDWYKLTDLPAMRRKNQVQQQGTGQDVIKESSFYMVAPFLGPLKSWIKQQHKLDRQKPRGGNHLAPPVGVPAITDDDDLHGLLDETPANDTPQPDTSFADMVARLGQTHWPSDALPELSHQPATAQPVDPAAELKRLLSVGSAVQSPPALAPPQQSQANSLLALFQQGPSKPQAQQPSLPRTPFDQMISPPAQPSSPHGQHQPRHPQMGSMPPPPFPFPQQHNLPFHGPSPHFNNGMHTHIPQNFIAPPQHPMEPMFPSVHAPAVHQRPGPMPPRPFSQSHENHPSSMDELQSPPSQPFGAQGHGPVVPPASKLPIPKINAHTLGLLNVFKTVPPQPSAPTAQQSPVQIQDSPDTQKLRHQPQIQHQPNELASPQFYSPPINIQPAQPKPRSAHQDSLLTLFRATPPPVASPEPAELSAHPTTPGYTNAQPATRLPQLANNDLLSSFNAQPQPQSLTSATVKRPVNVPDFDTMKKHTHPTSVSSRGPSPGTFAPQQILKRDQPHAVVQSPVELGARNGASPLTSDPTPTAFKPQILKRPPQAEAAPRATPTAHARSLLDMFKSPSPQPPASQPTPPQARSPASLASQADFDRHSSLPSEQKNTLLALFGKPSPQPATRIPAPLQPTHSPISTSRSPMPPTLKTNVSGIISPVSPLPDKGSHAASPADPMSRSRISSIEESGPPIIHIPPTSHPVEVGQSTQNFAGGLAAQMRPSDGKSPVDKTFLLGFLEDVARRGR